MRSFPVDCYCGAGCQKESHYQSRCEFAHEFIFFQSEQCNHSMLAEEDRSRLRTRVEHNSVLFLSFVASVASTFHMYATIHFVRKIVSLKFWETRPEM